MTLPAGLRPGVVVRRAAVEDNESVLHLLEAASLPVDGVLRALSSFLVAEDRGRVVGAVGLEMYGTDALLRSAVVDPAAQGTGIGSALVQHILEDARERGVQTVYLLTTTAEHYFPRFGFDRIGRDEVPDEVKGSIEFREVCPASAAVMRTTLSASRLTKGSVMEAKDKVFRVLFLCTGNSARSQIAQAMLNHKGRGRFLAESAGSNPASEVNTRAVEALERYGYPWAGGRPKHVDGLLHGDWDFVITVCDRAKEACPIFPGQPVVAHWGMPDPAAVEGPEDTKRRAFDDTVLTIGRHVDLLLAIPVEKLSRLALEHRIRDIGQTDPVAPALGAN